MDDASGDLPAGEQLDWAAVQPARASRSRGRRGAVVALAGLGTVAAVGAAVWGWQAWVGQGPQPAEALPANTLAYVAIDLDPPGQQKVEALGFLRQIPSIEEDLGLDTTDDARRLVFEELADEGFCDSLDYADDVEP